MNSSYAPSSESPASSLNAKWDGRARHRDYQFCGAVGFCIAFFLLCVIASIHGKSFMAMAFIALAAVAGLGASAIIHKILTGDERLVCYHQQFAALVASALLL